MRHIDYANYYFSFVVFIFLSSHYVFHESDNFLFKTTGIYCVAWVSGAIHIYFVLFFNLIFGEIHGADPASGHPWGGCGSMGSIGRGLFPSTPAGRDRIQV